ncbi:hypothetical protein BDFB_003824, partial [Asbolus verrucosus]
DVCLSPAGMAMEKFPLPLTQRRAQSGSAPRTGASVGNAKPAGVPLAPLPQILHHGDEAPYPKMPATREKTREIVWGRRACPSAEIRHFYNYLGHLPPLGASCGTLGPLLRTQNTTSSSNEFINASSNARI